MKPKFDGYTFWHIKDRVTSNGLYIKHGVSCN